MLKLTRQYYIYYGSPFKVISVVVHQNISYWNWTDRSYHTYPTFFFFFKKRLLITCPKMIGWVHVWITAEPEIKQGISVNQQQTSSDKSVCGAVKICAVEGRSAECTNLPTHFCFLVYLFCLLLCHHSHFSLSSAPLLQPFFSSSFFFIFHLRSLLSFN